MFWAGFGHSSGLFWACVGGALDMFWICSENVSGMFWACVGHVLGISRDCFGNVLGMGWARFGMGWTRLGILLGCLTHLYEIVWDAFHICLKYRFIICMHSLPTARCAHCACALRLLTV